MKRYRIQITTRHEQALMHCIANGSRQAWDCAFELARRLLGPQPPQHRISVRLV